MVCPLKSFSAVFLCDRCFNRSLARHLAEEQGLVKKENIYLLTDKGLALAPIILELVLWSDKYVREYNLTMNPYKAKMDKTQIIENTQAMYVEFAGQFMA